MAIWFELSKEPRFKKYRMKTDDRVVEWFVSIVDYNSYELSKVYQLQSSGLANSRESAFFLKKFLSTTLFFCYGVPSYL